MGFCWYHNWNIFHLSDFYLINKTFTFKLFLSGDKFGFAGNILAWLSANITIHNVVTGIINEPQFQTSWNLCISAFEPKPSSLFWLYTSVNVASDVPASVNSTSLFLRKNFVWRFCFLLIVVTCKLLCLSQLCTFKDRIINVGV